MIFHPNISTIISLFTLYRPGSPSVSIHIQLSLHPKLYESIRTQCTRLHIYLLCYFWYFNFLFWYICSHLGVLTQVKYKSPSFILRVIQRKCEKTHGTWTIFTDGWEPLNYIGTHNIFQQFNGERRSWRGYLLTKYNKYLKEIKEDITVVNCAKCKEFSNENEHYYVLQLMLFSVLICWKDVWKQFVEWKVNEKLFK